MPTITATVVETRSSADVPFFEMSDEVKAHRKSNYIDTGIILFGKITYSDDQLQKTFIQVFINNESRLTYLNDPVFVAFREQKEAHNTQNNIEANITFTTE